MAIYSHLNLDYLVSLSLVVAWRSPWLLDKFLYVSCLVQDMACWDVLQALGDQHPFLLRGMGHGVVVTSFGRQSGGLLQGIQDLVHRIPGLDDCIPFGSVVPGIDCAIPSVVVFDLFVLPKARQFSKTHAAFSG